MIILTLVRWFAASILISIARIVAYLITPIVVAFADRETGRLPRAFWWMETPTATLPGPPSITGRVAEKYGFWAASVYWLWRNATYALSDSFRVDPDFLHAEFRQWGDAAVENDPYRRGWFFGTIRWPGGWAFEFRAVGPMPWRKCWYFRIGWKLSAWFEGRRPEYPTATGMLQVPSLRLLQSRQ